MNNKTANKMGELRGRKKSKEYQKISKRKVRYIAKKEIESDKFLNLSITMELAQRIYKFLDEYACIRPDWDSQYDDDDDKFTSPDASYMKYCADMISKGLKPTQCWSEWGSGGYKPYISKEGREEHDYLVKEIHKIING